MEPIYLVDGSGYIFRAYYAVQPLSTTKGFPTNAIYGFTRMLLKLLRDVQAKYIAVAFDREEPTFRHLLYPEYKANRIECPEDLSPQMPYFRKVVEALGIKSLEQAGFEADDIIATLTKRLEVNSPVIIVSGDKDLTQLVNDKVVVWDAMREVRFNASVVREKFGVFPEQIVDYLSLVGDSSDNIPGVRGIGPKTAEALIGHFGSIDSMLQDLSKITEISGLRGARTLQSKLESASESIRLSRSLVILDCNVQPFSRIDSVEEFVWTDIQPELAYKLFEDLEFTKLIESLPEVANLNTKSPNNSNQINKTYETITNDNLENFAKTLSQVKEFAFDTETSSLDVFECELVGISISWEKHKAYYLPIFGNENTVAYLNKQRVLELLGPIFANDTIKKCGQNIKFDINVLESHGYKVKGISFDTMLASYLLHPDIRKHGLKNLAKTYLNETMITFEELLGKSKSIADVPLERVAYYACHDADATFQLKGVLDKKLKEVSNKERSVESVFNTIELPLVPVLSRIERNGIKIDTQFLEKLSAEFGESLQGLESRIYKLAGIEFNINSPKQLSEVLFEKLNISTTGVKKTQTYYSTDASVLTKLKSNVPQSDIEILDTLLEYRELFKLKSTYVDALKRLVKQRSGRIHTSFNQAIAATGRLSSSDPNLQNIPIRNPRGRQIRQCFIADDGYSLISADYSQIELRVLAELSGDENLQGIFRRNEDIHSSTAKELFGSEMFPPGEASDLRRIAKTINFGIIYGMGAFRLANELGIPRKQAQAYIDNYFSRYPRVKEYYSNLATQIEQLGYVETYFGRRRILADIDTSGRDKGYAIRSLNNAPIQGTAAEIIKYAMIEIDKGLRDYFEDAKMVLQVHDELVFEVKNEIIEEISNIVVDIMETTVKLSIPLKVDVKVGKNWGEVL
jgi:DNA polymerase I